ncbi:MAG: OmpA family protein [Alphaproteobacteria bacterium]|nr:OmpA family protein [Alphaproteobacteria bacterium]
MKLRTILLAATALAAATTANASTGWYMSLGAGANWLPDGDWGVTGGETSGGQTEYDTGFAVVSAVGYDWGRWRAEFEIAYRENDINCNSTSGNVCSLGTNTRFSDEGIWEFSQMVNVLYDFDLGGRFSASVGAGVGGVLVVADPLIAGFSDTRPVWDDYVVAGQLIGQVAYDLTDRWKIYADYRYMLADDAESQFITNFGTASWEKSDHTVLLGLRFDLQRDVKAAPPVAPQPPVAPKAPRQFIVFFGFDKSNLTPEAARVVADAAAAAKEYGSASIKVIGHTDTSGSPSYNQALSMRRSQAVKDGLAANGIPASAVSTAGRGEAELMVQTGDGVKEPQNRRATIDLN